jgi:hypothetical protein
MANYNRSDLKVQTGNNIPDNTSEAITPAIDRGDRENYADSLVSRLDDSYSKYLGTTGGTGAALTLTSLKDYPTANYDANMVVIFKMDRDNSASPTININSNIAGALNIYDDLTNQITDAGNLVSGRYYAGVYSANADGASGAGFVIILRFGSSVVETGVRTALTTYTIGAPGTYVFDGTSAAAWTLPAGSASLQWSKFYLSNLGTANISLGGAGADPIAGTDPFIIYPGTGLKTVVWDGETWIISN